MSAFTQAFHARMVGDATLVGLLGSFNGLPAVLTQRPVPPGFDIKTHSPYVLTVAEALADPGETDVKNSGGRTIVRDILCYTSLLKDPKVVEDVAERVRDLFHRQTSVPVSGYTIIVAEASGPILLEEEDAHGRVVSVRWALEES